MAMSQNKKPGATSKIPFKSLPDEIIKYAKNKKNITNEKGWDDLGAEGQKILMDEYAIWFTSRNKESENDLRSSFLSTSHYSNDPRERKRTSEEEILYGVGNSDDNYPSITLLKRLKASPGFSHLDDDLLLQHLTLNQIHLINEICSLVEEKDNTEEVQLLLKK